MAQSKLLRRTPLYPRHVALGAKLASFGGYELPISYTRIMEEHEWVRSSCGIFDVSHLGEVKITGRGAFPYIQKMVPSDLGKISDGQIMYTILLNEDGGIMDDILVYRLNLNAFYLVINASGIAKVMDHLERHKTGVVTVKNESDLCSCVAIQGPKAAAACDKLFDRNASSMKYYEFKALEDLDPSAWISRTGYTGEDGFEIFANAPTILKVWDRLMENDKKLDIRPVGLGARNTLRLEAGNGLYGTDIDETKTPFEARLQWLVSPGKTDFIGRQKLLQRKNTGFRHKLCGFKVLDRAVAREGYPLWSGAKKIGVVTSGSFSPTLKSNIGLGYVEIAFVQPGTRLDVEIYGRHVPVEIVKLPFVPLKHK